MTDIDPLDTAVDARKMKIPAVAIAIVVLCYAGLMPQAGGSLPPTNQVSRYERCDFEWKWREVTNGEGEVILACLRDMDKFTPCASGFNIAGSQISHLHPIPAVLGFRVISTTGETNLVRFSRSAQVVDCPRGRLVVPEKEEAILAGILAKWRKEDDARIASQPLPCKYRLWTADDGGTLSGVSRLFYGDASKWREIYEANRTVIKNPDLINGSMVITIPRLRGASNQSSAVTPEPGAPP